MNSVKARLAHLLQWLCEAKPDVVLLQELKCETAAFPALEIEDCGYNIAVYGQKTYNGVAILSRHPIEDVTRGLPTFTDDNARYIEAFTAGLRVASVYVPNGQSRESDKFAYKLAFYEGLAAHLQGLLTLEEATVIGGDFNVALSPLDICEDPATAAKKILYYPEERAALRRVLHHGYADSFRALHPEQQAYSWWDYRAGSFANDEGYRIDYLLTSPMATDRLAKAWIDASPRGWEKPSDHTPVLVLVE